MIKSKDKKTNPLDQIAKRIEKYVETYDSPVIHDPISNTFKTENQIKHETGTMAQNKKVPKMSATDTYLFKGLGTFLHKKI